MLAASSQVFPPLPGLSAGCRVDSICPGRWLSTRRLHPQSRRYLGVSATTGSSWCCCWPLAAGRHAQPSLESLPSYFTFRARVGICVEGKCRHAERNKEAVQKQSLQSRLLEGFVVLQARRPIMIVRTDKNTLTMKTNLNSIKKLMSMRLDLLG